MESQLSKQNQTRLLGREEKALIFVGSGCWLSLGEKDGLLCPAKPELDPLTPPSLDPPNPKFQPIIKVSNVEKGKGAQNAAPPPSPQSSESSFSFNGNDHVTGKISTPPASEGFLSANSEFTFGLNCLKLEEGFIAGPSSMIRRARKKSPRKIRKERKLRKDALRAKKENTPKWLTNNQAIGLVASQEDEGCSKRRKVQKRYHGRGELRFGFCCGDTSSEQSSSDSTSEEAVIGQLLAHQ